MRLDHTTRASSVSVTSRRLLHPQLKLPWVDMERQPDDSVFLDTSAGAVLLQRSLLVRYLVSLAWLKTIRRLGTMITAGRLILMLVTRPIHHIRHLVHP